jgi:hypothetical protein
VLTGALARPQAQGRLIIERMAANMSELRRRLRRQEFHVFHFVGHGRYRHDWSDGVLVMEDRNARAHEVTGEELGGLLNECDQTRLAVLNACEGARGDVRDPFAGMAQSLIQQGLPAVVAMQFEITDDAAIVFAQVFYGAIADGYPVEAALAEARGAIRDEGNPTEWGTPVLYSRAPDGRLFDLTHPSRISEADRKIRGEADRKAQEEDVDMKGQAGSSHGGREQKPATGSGKFDDVLIAELRTFHRDLCPVVQDWIKHKPSVNALGKLVEISDRLSNVIYSRYRDGKEKDADLAIILEKLTDKIRLAAFGLNDMQNADGNLPPEERLSLYNRLLELDGMLELVLRDSAG